MTDRYGTVFQDASDEIIDADFRDLVKSAEEDVGPEPPYWYKPERSLPNLTEIIDLAHAERSDHALRVIQSTLFESRVGLEFSSVFDRDVDWVKVGEIEQWQSPLLRNEHDALIAYVESQSLQPRAVRRSLADAEESTAKEAYYIEAINDWERTHLISGDGTLLSSLAYDATVHAMWSIYLAPDPGNYRTGQRYRRVDPKIVYPVFEGDRGVGHVYVVHDALAKDMLAWYGDQGPATKKIKDMAQTKDGRLDLYASHECIYYCNRTWEALIWGGKLIRKFKHKRWRVPWVILPFCWRRMTSSVSIGAGMATGMWGEVLAPDDQGIMTVASSRQRDLARVHEPFLAPRLPLHDQMEKIASRLITGVRRAQNPPLVWTRPVQHGNRPPPEIANWEGGVTEVPEGGVAGTNLDALPTLPVAESMDPLMQIITTSLQAGVPLPLLQGSTLGAQSSGSAIDVLMQSGFDKWIPVIKGVQMGLTEVAHTLLLNVKEWGPTMGKGVSGTLEIPRRTPEKYGLSAVHELTAEMLERTDCYLDVTLARFNINGMLQAATTLATIRNQVGVMSKREAAELLAYTNNVDRSLQMRRDEELEETPGVLEAMTIEHLYEELYAAYVTGDMESVRRIAIRGKRVAARQKLADMQLAAMGGGGDFGSGGIPPGGEVSPDGTPLPLNQGSVDPTMMGAATPMLPTDAIGNSVGTEGGRMIAGPPV
jgi:hypothetical protein